jgi:putative oxidoreductase
MKDCRTHTIASWTLQLIAAAILAQTLFFKFSGAEESKFIFTTLGAEPWGRVASGCAELVAIILLLAPRTVTLGALLALGVMTGAIGSHLTKLGIVVQNDGGLLFGLALTVFACSAVVLLLRRREIPVLGSLFVPLHELNCGAKGCQH